MQFLSRTHYLREALVYLISQTRSTSDQTSAEFYSCQETLPPSNLLIWTSNMIKKLQILAFQLPKYA